jgi:hypothetical protein
VEIEIVALNLVGSFTADNKVYDSTTSATVLIRSLATVIAPDVVTLDGGTATFDTKNVGNGKTVTLAGAALAGADAGNYSLTSVNTTTADITPYTGIIATAEAANKVYDATTAATALLSFGNIFAGDDLTPSGYTSATFDTADVGTGKTVTVTGITGAGADIGNYTWNTSDDDLADITPADATISVTPYSVVYDSNAHTALGSATGVLGEALTGLNLSGTTHTAAGSYPTDPWAFTDVTGNYNDDLGTVADSIGQVVLTVTAENKSKQYSDPVPGFTVAYSGFVGGDDSGNLTGTLSCTSTGTQFSPKGNYPISCSGLTS